MKIPYKIVPFEIELAKKIQSGEIEGRIVTKNGGEARILAFDSKSYFVDSQIECYTSKDKGINKPLVVEYLDVNGDFPCYQVVNLLSNGKLVTWGDSDCDLVIELPEKTPKHTLEDEQVVYKQYKNSSILLGKILKNTDFNSNEKESFKFVKKYLDDIINMQADRLEETPKHEFKVGDKVKLHILHHDEPLIKQYDGKLVEIDNVIDENKIWVKVHHDSIILNFKVFLDEIEFCKELINKSEHEFKPFDKVLVRNISGEWIPKHYSRSCILDDGTYNDGYMTTDDKRYRYCIPYEGHEHLIGTTNNPE